MIFPYKYYPATLNKLQADEIKNCHLSVHLGITCPVWTRSNLLGWPIPVLEGQGSALSALNKMSQHKESLYSELHAGPRWLVWQRETDLLSHLPQSNYPSSLIGSQVWLVNGEATASIKQPLWLLSWRGMWLESLRFELLGTERHILSSLYFFCRNKSIVLSEGLVWDLNNRTIEQCVFLSR